MDEYLDGKRNGGIHAPVHLAMYTYVSNNPLIMVDPDGKDGLMPITVDLQAAKEFSNGVITQGGAILSSLHGCLSPERLQAASTWYGEQQNATGNPIYAIGGTVSEIMASHGDDVIAALSTVRGGAPKGAAASLPQMKGMGAAERESIFTTAGFSKTRVSNSAGRNETWSHSDGSEVRVHPYGNENASQHKSGNNAHLHKQDSAGNQLNDRGQVSTNPNDTHIGVPNPSDFSSVRGRPDGS